MTHLYDYNRQSKKTIDLFSMKNNAIPIAILVDKYNKYVYLIPTVIIIFHGMLCVVV